MRDVFLALIAVYAYIAGRRDGKNAEKFKRQKDLAKQGEKQ